ncbi:molybdopterin-guanine dinucleotide biosynthesis protein B [Methylocapsa palsarum]|uniref:Molybdopterin-guanine dinucleotide biosynthesis protein B n=1 Tax=Methylocapsa palsarum TaxID=1612308 RepID=A0A1I3WTA5_9HYPH|nr:molybdopterin-guanine dinucleotide biosynthesis protein B [Methylocapsa palsarum]SFK10580.1 molybdopterin-guanine dinucleotide biosynthesis protein B [Methylocapsa palsarum]
MRVIGLTGWSGAGKTTLIVRLIPVLRARGFSVSTLKHAHHAFDVDMPGKDSYRHREAGAAEVLVASSRRWALMHEMRDESEPVLASLLARMSPVDLVLVEGYKLDAHAKIEIHRAANGKPPLFPDDPSIAAFVSDADFGGLALPRAHLDDAESVADLCLELSRPLEDTLLSLAPTAGTADR